MPRFSGDQARHAVEDDAEDRLIGGARRQVDFDLLFQFDDARGDLDEAQPQSVELHNTPGRAFGHQPAHRPEEPVGTGVKEEAELNKSEETALREWCAENGIELSET